MDKASDPLLDAALGVFARYGKRKTTMGDIAAEAGVSRQTLYGRFDNKDGVLRAVIHHVSDQVLGRCARQWASVEGLGDKLWIYFEHAVIGIYQMIQAAPDAEDLVSGKDVQAMAAFGETQAAHIEALVPLFRPHAAQLAQSGQDPRALARFVIITSGALKHAAATEDELRAGLRTLQASVLALVGER